VSSIRFKWFKRKPKEEKVEEKKEEKPRADFLREACGDDERLYSALLMSRLLDPQRVLTAAGGVTKTLKDYVKEGKEHEKKGDNIRARVMYRVAGGLALYEGDLEQVKRNFKKCAELYNDQTYMVIVENPKKAINIVRQTYKRESKLKSETK
jgi:hypothetical protein